MVRIRLQRIGAKKRPFYRIIAVDSKVKRDGKFIEILGQYHPLSPEGQQLTLKEDRIEHWVSKGAQSSDTMTSLFKRSGLWKKLSTKKTAS